jgi:hypothetical protein
MSETALSQESKITLQRADYIYPVVISGHYITVDIGLDNQTPQN